MKGKVIEKAEKTGSRGGEERKASEPPPKRDLPFTKERGGGVGDGKAVKVQTKVEGHGDEGEETSDDEL